MVKGEVCLVLLLLDVLMALSALMLDMMGISVGVGRGTPSQSSGKFNSFNGRPWAKAAWS